MTAAKIRRPDIDILHGPIGRGLFRLAVPIALTQMLQQLFNAADIAVVGQFSGKNAMAAPVLSSALSSPCFSGSPWAVPSSSPT